MEKKGKEKTERRFEEGDLMSKPRKRLHVRLPPYAYPRLEWRKAIHAEVWRAAQSRDVKYDKDDRLEVEVVLYLDESGLPFHDVDNRLKDILDALQGRVGGPKKQAPWEPIIRNDHQVYRAVIEKRIPPGQSHGRSHLIIRKMR